MHIGRRLGISLQKGLTGQPGMSNVLFDDSAFDGLMATLSLSSFIFQAIGPGETCALESVNTNDIVRIHLSISGETTFDLVVFLSAQTRLVDLMSTLVQPRALHTIEGPAS